MTCERCAPGPDVAFDSGCACDHRASTSCEDIAIGLSELPPPAPGFADYRERLLSAAALRPALAGWSARADDDLGVMLLEGWAYVLDILRFYDRQIASNSYLRTATDPLALRRLVALIGYRPRPAVAAQATLALIASGRDPSSSRPAPGSGARPPALFPPRSSRRSRPPGSIRATMAGSSAHNGRKPIRACSLSLPKRRACSPARSSSSRAPGPHPRRRGSGP